MPTDDPLFGKGTIRVDGRKIHPAYLVRSEEAGRVQGPVGLLQVERTVIPGGPGLPSA
jgi:branched-chain amino acid transport system substrate-binding protein